MSAIDQYNPVYSDCDVFSVFLGWPHDASGYVRNNNKNCVFLCCHFYGLENSVFTEVVVFKGLIFKKLTKLVLITLMSIADIWLRPFMILIYDHNSPRILDS